MHRLAAAVTLVGLLALMVLIVRLLWRGTRSGVLRPSRGELVAAITAGVIGLAAAAVSLLTS